MSASLISVRKWRLSRAPFVAYIGLIAACALTFFLIDAMRLDAEGLVTLAWLLGAVLVLALPVVLSMRLRDIGLHPLWAFIPLIGVLIAAIQMLGALSAIGGTPGSTPASRSQTISEWVGLGCLGVMAILAVFGLFAPSRSLLRKAEVAK